MGGVYSTHVGEENAYVSFGKKSEGNRPLRRFRLKWEDIIDASGSG